MTVPSDSRSTPPRLAARTLLVTFGVISLILAAVGTVLVMEMRDRAAASMEASLTAGQRMVALLDSQRASEIEFHARPFTSDRTIGLALRRLQRAPAPTPDEVEAFQRLVEQRIHELDDETRLDAVAVVDREQRTVARSGRHAHGWPLGRVVSLPDRGQAPNAGAVYRAGRHLYHVVALPITVEDERVGELHLTTALDSRYAQALSSVTRAKTLVVANGQLVADTLPAQARASFGGLVAAGLPADGLTEIDGEAWAIRRVLSLNGATVFAAGPVGETRSAAVREMWLVLSTAGAAALLLGAIASIWLARTISRPIDELSRTLSEMATSRRFDVRLPRPGTSRELDALTDTFNELMRSLAVAEAETRAAYVGAIRALAAALDARDPYTAGHSERVSALSVTIGRYMAVVEPDIDVLRLGALLHDIGKIGVSDNVLRKPGPLTAEEFEAIKTHPRLGSRILRSVPFLAPHLPIVELHHERPDGQGYPHGLAGDEIPLLARIVRVADAFDAMTSARAYRPARPAADAITELWRYAGSQFDAEVVEALVKAWPSVAPSMTGGEWGSFDTARLRAVIPFHPRPAEKGA